MFNNIGSKIKILASCIFWISSVVSVIIGIFYLILAIKAQVITVGLSYIILGLLIPIVGIIASWICGMFVYGFGELIEKTSKIEECLKNDVE